ncbi:hypothetical protein D2N39_03310 [Gemmobacter lutimaris]|uniref:HTH HARE-type domain-containing protein n=1 Tax=Gemmobacter lutimaris TaxID=2306023 RepID=A0A398BV07_9RHOB|nr:HTH domain-containing protein [Gemmobacter lutimaris]RID92721.1 hypothetical protein D2N39_03310 [Gemmobacter lutimaris]
MSDLAWKEAAIAVLTRSGQALHYKTIAEKIEEMKLRRSLDATPANTVFVAINNSIKNEGEVSPFIKTNPGIFMLRSETGAQIDVVRSADQESEIETKSIVKSVGMYWHASKVIWRHKPRLLGQQQQGAKSIDFCEQVGIYLLYDRSRVIYVGRSVDRPLGVRLSEHTRDRLNGRWDRFSWFGLKGVDSTGKLGEPDFSVGIPQIISLMEAILIESLEPSQNRKRGDDFSDIEFLQIADQEKRNQTTQALLTMIQQQWNEGEE